MSLIANRLAPRGGSGDHVGMDRLALRLDLFPVLTTVIPEKVDEADLAIYLPRFEAAAFEHKVPVIHLMDATRMTTPPGARVRRVLAEWRQAVIGRGIAKYLIGSVVATPSILVRGSLTAIGWLVPNPIPHTWVADLPTAIAWAIARFEKSGHPVPAVLSSYRGE